MMVGLAETGDCGAGSAERSGAAAVKKDTRSSTVVVSCRQS